MMTRIWILSDLHIDANPDLELGPHPDCDVIVMAGDLADGTHDITSWLLSDFSGEERAKLVFVPGNHEYYGLGIERGREWLSAIAEATGITILDNGVAEVAGQRFVGTTLWSPINLSVELQRFVGDTKYIPDFTQDDWRRLHAEAVDFLDETVQPGDVVITHHAPSYEGRSTEMQHNIRKAAFSSAYASRLDDRIEAWQPALVIHGHTHIKSSYQIGGVPIESMACGRGWGVMGFKPDYVVETVGYQPKPPGF